MTGKDFDRRACLAYVGAGLAGSTGAAHGAATPKTVKVLVQSELSLAKVEGRTLALFFLATWCPYCRLFNMVLSDAKAGPVFDRYFRLLRINVRERKSEMKALQTPGAEELWKSYVGNETGIPMFVFLTAGGKVASTSISDKGGANIGFPVADEELDWLDVMLARAAPKMPGKHIAVIRAACVRIYNKKA